MDNYEQKIDMGLNSFVVRTAKNHVRKIYKPMRRPTDFTEILNTNRTALARTHESLQQQPITWSADTRTWNLHAAVQIDSFTVYPNPIHVPSPWGHLLAAATATSAFAPGVNADLLTTPYKHDFITALARSGIPDEEQERFRALRKHFTNTHADMLEWYIEESARPIMQRIGATYVSIIMSNVMLRIPDTTTMDMTITDLAPDIRNIQIV